MFKSAKLIEYRRRATPGDATKFLRNVFFSKPSTRLRSSSAYTVCTPTIIESHLESSQVKAISICFAEALSDAAAVKKISSNADKPHHPRPPTEYSRPPTIIEMRFQFVQVKANSICSAEATIDTAAPVEDFSLHVDASRCFIRPLRIAGCREHNSHIALFRPTAAGAVAPGYPAIDVAADLNTKNRQEGDNSYPTVTNDGGFFHAPKVKVSTRFVNKNKSSAEIGLTRLSKTMTLTDDVQTSEADVSARVATPTFQCSSQATVTFEKASWI